MEFVFHGTDGKRYELSPMTLGNMRQFKEWVQLLPYSFFLAHKDLMPPEQAAQEGSRVLKECLDRHLTEGSPEVTAAMDTMEGALHLLHLMLRKNHPTLTVEELEDVVTVSSLQHLGSLIKACNAVAGDEKKTTPASSST
jgi:hypothetical protein